MAEVLFFLAAIGALAGALGTVALRNPFYSVLALVCHLLSLAALFLLLRAEFVAAAQVIVYVGAVMVLYVFVVAYVGGSADPITTAGRPSLRWASALFAGALFVELSIAVLGTGLSALSEEGSGWFEGFGTPAEIGRLLLLIAAVGAVILARRRTGLEDPREISVGDLMRTGSRDQLTGGEAGTMIEVEGPPGR
jgi:NADH-quinone oxidoreductase subunit J